VDTSATPLAGALEYVWTIDDPTVATLEPDAAGSHRVTITAVGALGDQTSLEVAAAGLTYTVDVSVQEPGDTGSGDDGGTTSDGGGTTTESTGQTTDGSGTTGGGTTTTGGTATTSTGSTSTP
jgi:5'-nucleotidase